MNRMARGSALILMAAFCLALVAPLHVAVFQYSSYRSDILEFVSMLGMVAIFSIFLTILFVAVWAIGKRIPIIPFLLAFVVAATIAILNANEGTISSLTEGFLVSDNGLLFTSYFDLLDLSLLVVLIAGSIAVVRTTKNEEKLLLALAVVFALLAIWLGLLNPVGLYTYISLPIVLTWQAATIAGNRSIFNRPLKMPGALKYEPFVLMLALALFICWAPAFLYGHAY